VEQIKTSLTVNTKNRTVLIYTAIAIWLIIYIFAIGYGTRADSTDKAAFTWITFLSVYALIPTFISTILFSWEHFGHTNKYWKLFTGKLWITIPLIIVVTMPMFDLLNYYLNWGYIVPGTWSSFGLMMLCYLLIIRKLGTINAKVVILAILGSYLFISGWEAQYIARYTIHFWQNPLSFYDALSTSVHVIATLPFAIFAYIYYKAYFSKWTWILLGITILMMVIPALSRYFTVAWDGNSWINIEPNSLIYYISRASKVTLALAIASITFGRIKNAA